MGIGRTSNVGGQTAGLDPKRTFLLAVKSGTLRSSPGRGVVLLLPALAYDVSVGPVFL